MYICQLNRVDWPGVAEATTTARTPRGQGLRLRERLLDAGLELVTEHGDGLHATIRAVTKRAGVSPTAFYLHFATRDEFLAALKQRGFEEFRTAITEAADTGGEDPAARLRASALGYIRFARERPSVYALIFSPVHLLEEGSWDPDAPGPAAFKDLVARVTAYLDHAGREKTAVEPVALALWTGLHGWVTLSYAARKMDWPTDEEFVARLAQAWLGPAPGDG
jgi:AcrR family transcriptional regulator